MKRMGILCGVALLILFAFISCGSGETAETTEMKEANFDDLKKAVGPDGTWMIRFANDITVNEELVISGEFYETEEAKTPSRELALSPKGSDKHYALTVPRLVIEHSNTHIQGGEVAGTVYVNAEGFGLIKGAVINGNLIYASDEIKESATIDESAIVMGKIRTGSGVDAVSSATKLTATNAETLQEAVGPDGSWIIIFEGDLSVDQEIVVFGAVYEDEEAEAPRRKLALYAQDENRNITERYTLSLPKLTIKHQNTRIQGGIVEGDVYVYKNGFELNDAKIKGKLFFASPEYRQSAVFSGNSSVDQGIIMLD